MKHKMNQTTLAKRLLALVMVGALILSLGTPSVYAKKVKVKVSKVKITNIKGGKLTMINGTTKQLKVKVTVKPNKAANRKVTYRSSKPSYVSVSKKGLLKAKKDSGTAKITVTSVKNKKKKTTLKITLAAPKPITYAWQTPNRLRDVYASHFKLGVGMTRNYLDGKCLPAQILDYHFNSLTMGNEMKPDSLLNWQQSEENAAAGRPNDFALNLDNLDKDLTYAKEHGLQMRFHVFVWHQQTPEWFFHTDFDMDKPLVDSATMLLRMQNYITQIIDYIESRYPGVVYAYDVVNEALEDSAGKFELIDGVQYRTRDDKNPSLWYQIIGSSFIKKAFEYAKAALVKNNSSAKTFYNDYNCYQRNKTSSIINLVKSINADGHYLDGIGMQSHISMTYPDITTYENTIKKFSELGVEIHITELDIGVTFPERELPGQGDYYKQILTMYTRHPAITSVTIWGINDGNGNWRTMEYPLLFDYDCNPKPAFYSLLS